ncbi:hypothetical protein IG631_24281 [Alternaria alternata]|nr:hypothetical protein IG631_24281 [Alternaria alternata]
MSTHCSPGLEKAEQSKEAEVITSKHLGACFAGLAELRALHQSLLKNLGVKCFVEGYQTTLEAYFLELEAHTALEKEIVRIPADCNNRSSIASEIVTVQEDARSTSRHTQRTWDWRPLQKSVPLLKPGEFRLDCKVSVASSIVYLHANDRKFIGETMYTVLSIQEAETIAQVLDTMKGHPSRCYCCKP